MKRILHRFSIMQLVITSTALLVLFVVLMVIFNAVQMRQEMHQLKADSNLVEILSAIEQVAHHHAVERGLTAGFLASKSPQQKEKVVQQRKKADQAVATLSTKLQQSSHPKLETRHTQVLFNKLVKKNEIRNAVDQLNGQGAFNYYSTLNSIALDTATQLKDLTFQPELGEQFTVAFLLARYKEKMGQIRGKVNGILAAITINAEQQKELTGFVNELALISLFLENNASPDVSQSFVKLKNDTLFQSNKQTVQKIITDFGANQSSLPTNDQWFADATQQIGAIKNLLDIKWTTINEYAHQRYSEIKQFIATSLGILAIALGLVFTLNIHLILRLKSTLKHLVNALSEVENGNLHVTLRVNQSDELGYVSKAMSQTVDAFKHLLIAIEGSVNKGADLNEEMNTITEIVLQDSQKTQSMATNIATAIEQMSQTSKEIAESASNTLSASENLHQVASQLITNSEHSQTTIGKLLDSMSEAESRSSEMENQVSEIYSILDTISSIAEQTNLLALNAAIEAARAGDHGRGFAVVADEVRSLASNSKASSEKIAELLQQLKSMSDNVVSTIQQNISLSNQTSADFKEVKALSTQIFSQSETLDSLATSVASAAEQQSMVAAEIAGDTAAVQDFANHELEATQDLERIFKKLVDNSRILESHLEKYAFK